MRQSLLTFPKSTKPVDPPNRPAPIERNNPQSDNTVQHKTQGQLSGSLGKTVQSKSSTMFTNKESDDVSFEWLFKVFQSEGSAKSIKYQINLPSNRHIKYHIVQVLSYFTRSSTKSKADFAAKCQSGSPLNLKNSYMGFEHAAIIRCDKIDTVWLHLITRFCKYVHCQYLIAARLLRWLVKYHKIYRKLYRPYIGYQVFKINTAEVDALFTSTDKTQVNDYSELYLRLLRGMIDRYFKELTYALNLLLLLMGTRYYVQFFHSNFIYDDHLLRQLWVQYKQFALGGYTPKPPSQSTDKRQQTDNQLQDDILAKTTKIYFSLSKLLYKLVEDKYPSYRLDKFQVHDYQNQPKNFYLYALEYIDNDTCKFVDNFVSPDISCDGYVRVSTNLIVLIFPWHHFDRQQSGFTDVEVLKDAVKTCKSESLAGIRMLFECYRLPYQYRVRYWMDVIYKKKWMMYGRYWRKWLGVFLQGNIRVTLKNDKLEKLVVGLCKRCIAEYIDLFWTVNKSHSQSSSVLQSSSIDRSYTIVSPFSRSDTFYMVEIMRFMQSMIEHNHITQCLPLLTKSLGNSYHNHTEYLFTLEVMGDSLIYMVSKVYYNLNLYDYSTSLSHQRNGKIELASPKSAAQTAIEQEVKFLSRLVIINIRYLESVEERIMLVDTANSCGIYLLSLLIRCVFELGVSDTSAVKCVRYALQAIDCAFFYLGTRHTLLYALCMCQNDNSMILKEIVQQCSTDHGNCSSEESIQCYKLRRIVSQHLNNILRLTDNLAEYFPLSSSTYLRSKYEQVNESLRRNNDTDGLAKRLIIQRVPFLASKWFYHLALVWQGYWLLPVDYYSIRLLMLKMRTVETRLAGYGCVELLVEVIGKGKLIQLVVNNLALMVNYEKSVPRLLFGLANHDIVTFLKGETGKAMGYTISANDSMGNKLTKVGHWTREMKKAIIGCISGSFGLIYTALRLSLADENYPLLDKFNFYRFVIDRLTNPKTLLTYTCTFLKLAYPEPYEAYPTTLNPPLQSSPITYELTTTINLLHTISAYIDFEHRHELTQTTHANKQTISERTIDIGYDEYDEVNIVVDVALNIQSNDSILMLPFDAFYSQYDSIGVTSVLRVLGLMVLLGKGKLVYEAVNDRGYPITKGRLGNNVKTFMKVLIEMLGRYTINAKQKYQIFEFMTVVAKYSKWAEVVIECLPMLKEPIVGIYDNLKPNMLPLLNKILLFVNQILFINSTPTNSQTNSNSSTLSLLKTLRSLLGEPTILLKMILSFNSYCALPSHIYNGSSSYRNYQLHRSIIFQTYYKFTVYLFISISSYLHSHYSVLSQSGVLELLIRAVYDITSKPNINSGYIINELGRIGLHGRRRLQQLKTYNLYCFILKKEQLSLALSIYFGGFGREYLYDGWRVNEKLLLEVGYIGLYNGFDIVDGDMDIYVDGGYSYGYGNSDSRLQTIRHKVLEVYLLNVVCGLYDIHCMLSQFYYCFMLSVLKRGKYGCNISSYSIDNLLLYENLPLFKSNEMASYSTVCGVNLFGNNNKYIWSSLYALVTYLIEIDDDDDNHSAFTKEDIDKLSRSRSRIKQRKLYHNGTIDTKLLLISYLVITLSTIVHDNNNPHINLTEHKQLLHKILANLSTRRGTLRVEVLVLAALADLNYTTLVLGRSRNHNDYYDTANQLLKMVSGELGNIDWQNQDDLADSLLIITAFCNKIAVQYLYYLCSLYQISLKQSDTMTPYPKDITNDKYRLFNSQYPSKLHPITHIHTKTILSALFHNPSRNILIHNLHTTCKTCFKLIANNHTNDLHSTIVMTIRLLANTLSIETHSLVQTNQLYNGLYQPNILSDISNELWEYLYSKLIKQYSRLIRCHILQMLSELSLDHATSIDNNIIEFLGVEARTVLQSFDYRNGGINLESNIELTLLYRLMAIISKNENWTVSGYLVTLESCFYYVVEHPPMLDVRKMTPLCKVEKEFAVMGLMESRDGKLSDNYGRWTKGIFKNYNPYNATHNPKHNNAHNELSHPTGVYNPTNTIYSPMTNTSSPRYSKNLFEMLSYLRCQYVSHEYLLVLFQGVKNSRNLYQLYTRTLSNVYNYLTWHTLRGILLELITFYNTFYEIINIQPHILSQALAINRYLRHYSSFSYYFYLLNAFFEYYYDLYDLLNDIAKTLLLLGRTVSTLLALWRKHNWKSKMDWKNERIELINKYCEMGRRYCQVIVGKNDRKVSNEDNDDTGYKDIWKWLKDMVSNVDKYIEIENDL